MCVRQELVLFQALDQLEKLLPGACREIRMIDWIGFA